MPNRAQESTSAGTSKQGGRQGSAQQAMPDTAKPATDPTYNIVSVLYHALQGAQTYQQYSEDARQAGDAELQEFFDACRREEHARAVQAKSLLMDRLEMEDEAEGDEGEEEDDEDEEEEEED